MLTRFLPLGALLALGACTLPPQMNPSPPPPPAPSASVQTGLLNAEWNLDQAIAIGMLPANDHADACMHMALVRLGIEPPPPGSPPPKPPASFTPRVSDLISGGTVLYIQTHQARKASTAPTVLPSCMQIIGQFVLDGAAGANSVQVGNATLSR